jgi:hypothetical protein
MKFAKKVSRNGHLADARSIGGALPYGCLYQAKGRGEDPTFIPPPSLFHRTSYKQRSWKFAYLMRPQVTSPLSVGDGTCFDGGASLFP